VIQRWLSRLGICGSATLAAVLFGLAGCSEGGLRLHGDGIDRGDYPPAERQPVAETLHGEQVADPYRWLEDESSPATQRWIAAENALTERTMNRFAKVRDQVAKELEAVYATEAVSALVPYGERYFFFRRDGLENHAKVYVREGNYAAPEKVALDPNQFSADGTVALDWMYPSPDGRLIAYGKSSSGSEKSTLYVRDVAAGKDLSDQIPFTQYCTVAWNAAGTGFYYNRCPDPQSVPAGEENFHMKVYFHEVGADWEQDRYVWGEGRPKDEEPNPYESSDHEYVLLNFYRDPAQNDLYIKRADGPEPFQPVADSLGAITTGDVLDGRVYLKTNYQAPRYRLCTADVSAAGPDNWRDLIPQQKGVLDGFDIVDHKLIVHVIEDVRSRLLVYDLDGQLQGEVPLPGPGTVAGFGGAPEQSELFFTFSSWIVPTTSYRYDVRSKKLEELHRRGCPVDLTPYETRQVWCRSTDGTEIPLFIVARKDVKLDGNNPALLYGYGGFNVSLYPGYRASILPFLQRGGVWALANIRGGGEFGQAWHDGGRREHKQQCFDDFYAAAEKLIDLGYTNPQRLACEGGSNGGLLIGAAVTQRPDLWQAAIAQVPLMDMLRFHLWGMGAQWVHEYGDPGNAEEYRWVRAYSPYHNVEKDVAYPATLLVTAESDNRVATAHAYKMTAELQWATGSDRPILIRIERKAGHGAGKPLSMRIQNDAEDWTFLMWQLGMLKKPARPGFRGIS